MQIMQKAQQLQKDMEKLKVEINNTNFEGTAGGGMVKVTINGGLEIKNIEVDDSIVVVEEKTLLVDLIIAAFNDAKNKANAYNDEKTKELTAGLPIPPGMKIPGMF